MKREIKFRAYSKSTNKILDWDFIKKVGNLQKLLTLNHVEVMQFTGLKDKNGVEIYFDSDLVNMKFTINCDTFNDCSYINTNEDGSKTYKKIVLLPSVLTIRNPTVGIEFYNKEFNIYTPAWSKYDEDINNLEIIGNIHQNPELL